MLSNKGAQELIDLGMVEIDGAKIFENCTLEEHSEIKVNGKIERKRKEYVYLKFHKPAGFESTLNTTIPDNISRFFDGYTDLAIAGRLDKQSEGLMILSNDGKWVENVCNPKFEKEKEYRVTLDKKPEQDFFTNFRNGVKIGNYFTAPCTCESIKDKTIKIVLTEGKNRQIRRMCKNLNYQVVKLVRIRIDHIMLENLEIGETQQINNSLILNKLQ